MGRLGKLGLGLLVAVPLIVVPHPAEATGTGGMVVTCTATFPTVPAPNWTPGGACVGVATGSAVGLDTVGVPYSLNGTGVFGAAFNYQEPCVVNGQPGVIVSFANGVATVVGVPAQHPIGTLTTANLTAPFIWRRVGLNPVIVVGIGTVTFANGGGAVINTGFGTATFVLPTNYDPLVHQCGVGGFATTGVVAAITFPV